MASRGTKRPATVGDAFVAEDLGAANGLKKDAKMTRQACAPTSTTGFWQQQLVGQSRSESAPAATTVATAATAAVTTATSNASASAAPGLVYPMPGASVAGTGDSPGVAAAAATGMFAPPLASSPAAMLSSADASPLERSKSLGGTSLFFCWLCKRKFCAQNALDGHVLHSRLHQESIRRVAGII
eukprot:TRINITY_DN48481_c0_g1_i1.p1 TRINITY_DN48481_c0_g1~~TRINITY_DN48481_c0_g1_i1.p1  ORF type:complete len:185 (+),score=16.36 TRINITY_DN48481_c0_g1_i1:55-609(+)